VVSSITQSPSSHGGGGCNNAPRQLSSVRGYEPVASVKGTSNAEERSAEIRMLLSVKTGAGGSKMADSSHQHAHLPPQSKLHHGAHNLQHGMISSASASSPQMLFPPRAMGSVGAVDEEGSRAVISGVRDDGQGDAETIA
jgi:hypothetical protein